MIAKIIKAKTEKVSRADRLGGHGNTMKFGSLGLDLGIEKGS